MCIPFFSSPSLFFLYPPKKTRPPLNRGFCLRPEVPPRPRALQSDGEVFDVKALSDLTLAERQRFLCLGPWSWGLSPMPTHQSGTPFVRRKKKSGIDSLKSEKQALYRSYIPLIATQKKAPYQESKVLKPLYQQVGKRGFLWIPLNIFGFWEIVWDSCLWVPCYWNFQPTSAQNATSTLKKLLFSQPPIHTTSLRWKEKALTYPLPFGTNLSWWFSFYQGWDRWNCFLEFSQPPPKTNDWLAGKSTMMSRCNFLLF